MTSEILSIISNPLVIWSGIVAIGLISAMAVHVATRRLREHNKIQDKLIRQLSGDVKLLFSATSAMETKIDELHKHLDALAQRQDQFTLQEPSQQAYRHAINLMKNGVKLDEVVEKSGLSRGELELLKLLNKFDVNEVA